jgi:L-alanine-DL-glutamate epimerase-like enolase superfamily enzyme
MLINKVEWRGIRIPLRRPASDDAAPDRHTLLVWMFTDDGRVGVGEAAPVGPGRPGRVRDVAEVLHDLAPAMLGLSPILGLETAVFDLLGQAAVRPITSLLGGTIDWVPVHAIIGFEEPEEAARQAAAAVADGYTCVKLSLGAREAGRDVETVARVREAVGPTVGLRADADERWTTERAIATINALEPYDLEYVEQPVIAEDLAGLARVRRAVSVPIAADEVVRRVEDAQRVIDAEAADVLVVKPAMAGGIRGAREIMALARQHGLGTVVASCLETGIGITAALHIAASFGDAGTAGLASGVVLADDLLATPMVPVRGHLTVPQTPGLGVELDPDAVDRYTSDVMGVIAG